MKTLGLIGGMSWESSAVYYRFINEALRERLGGLHSAKLLLWSFDFAEIEACQSEARWGDAEAMLACAAQQLETAGADALLIGTNTMHCVADGVQAAVGIPLIHIADATASAVAAAGMRRPALLGSRYTMEQDFYVGRLRRAHDLDVLVPDTEDRETVNRIIFDELCQGQVLERSRTAYLRVIETLRERGADGVILGCTEIGLLIKQGDLDLPALDTTRIHADAAVDFALA